MIKSQFLIAFSFAMLIALGQEPAGLNLMPAPAKVTPGAGQLLIDQKFAAGLTGYREPRLEAALQRLVCTLSRKTGVPLEGKPSPAAKPTLSVHCDHASKAVLTLGEDESYRLEVTPAGASLSAPSPLGVLRGMQTFLQLVEIGPLGFAAPAVVIDDSPRFPWRGLMLDVARHFMPLDVVKRTIDGMEAVKFNVFHWHLSDNQGFRVESRKYPKLQQMGSDGLFYTQDQVREIIAYARERGIRVVPEFDMPGHTTAWFVGYPELASGRGPYEIERHWGVFDPALDPTREEVYRFLDGLIGEMAQLFPDQYFHIGGDEVNGKEWDGNARIQEFKKAHGISSNEGLLTYFSKRVQQLVKKHGKTMEGWDEIMDPSIPKDILVQSWRGQKSLAEGARNGYPGLLSNGYYLDLMQPVSFHYSADPLGGDAASLNPEQQKLILGGEACLWSEYDTVEVLDSRIWPRAAAVAERLWSPQGVRDLDSMYRRLDITSRNLEWLGLTHRSNYRLMLQRMAGNSPVEPLKVLADLVEPVKIYARGEMREYTSSTPLNRLIDAARPESDQARVFSGMVDRLLAGELSAADKKLVRTWLAEWRDNHAVLLPTLQKSAVLQESIPQSENLSGISAAALRAMDYFESGEAAPVEWKASALALLDRAKEPKAEVLLMVVPPIRKLVEATK